MSGLPSDSRSSFRIFISFTEANTDLAEYLAKELRRLLDSFESVYYYKQPGTQKALAGSKPADNFMDNIDNYLKKCNIFILIWSKEAKKANWVTEEMNHARRLYVQKVRRLGRTFKIVPISIDKFSLPFNLKNVVRINHASGSDPQSTLNQVLKVLGLPEERKDPQIVFLENIKFEIRTAYRNEEWTTIIQKYAVLIQLYPSAVSASLHYMYAVALLKTGNIAQSLVVAQEGLTLENKEEDAALLLQIIDILKEKRQWNQVLALAKLASEVFPGDTHWIELQWEMANRPFFFRHPK